MYEPNNNYLTMMAVGMSSRKKLEDAKWGSKRREFKLWQAPKVEPPLYLLEEDDLP